MQFVWYPLGMAGWFADIFVEWFLRTMFHVMSLVRSRRWPIVEASVLGAQCAAPVAGCPVATIYYEYAVGGGAKYGTWFGRPFIFHASGEAYAAQFVKGLNFRIRVKPGDPTVVVPLWEVPPRNQKTESPGELTRVSQS